MHRDVILDLPELTLPHPRMHERAFVLAPMNEIAPFVEHPVSRKAIIDLLDELGGYEEIVWPANVEI
jgi:7,8-dihydro-6-hydroxymethylpterin-pyrophosphokinase